MKKSLLPSFFLSKPYSHIPFNNKNPRAGARYPNRHRFPKRTTWWRFSKATLGLLHGVAQFEAICSGRFHWFYHQRKTLGCGKAGHLASDRTASWGDRWVKPVPSWGLELRVRAHERRGQQRGKPGKSHEKRCHHVKSRGLCHEKRRRWKKVFIKRPGLLLSSHSKRSLSVHPIPPGLTRSHPNVVPRSFRIYVSKFLGRKTHTTPSKRLSFFPLCNDLTPRHNLVGPQCRNNLQRENTNARKARRQETKGVAERKQSWLRIQAHQGI